MTRFRVRDKQKKCNCNVKVYSKKLHNIVLSNLILVTWQRKLHYSGFQNLDVDCFREMDLTVYKQLSTDDPCIASAG